MAGLPPQYSSNTPFGQYSTGTEPYGQPNAAFGYGQGYEGLPYGFMGQLGGTPTGYNTQASNTAKMRGGPTNPITGGTQTPPVGVMPPPTMGTGGGNQMKSPGGPTMGKTPRNGGRQGTVQGNQLPWAPWHHDYNNAGGQPPTHGGVSGGGFSMGTPGSQSGKLSPGGPGQGGPPQRGGPIGTQPQNPYVTELLAYLQGGGFAGGGGGGWAGPQRHNEA